MTATDVIRLAENRAYTFFAFSTLPNFCVNSANRVGSYPVCCELPVSWVESITVDLKLDKNWVEFLVRVCILERE